MTSASSEGKGQSGKGAGGVPLVRSVERAGRVLEALVTAPPEGMTLAEVAAQSHLHKTTALRILRTLTSIGLVRRFPVNDRYAWDALRWFGIAARLSATLSRVNAVQGLLDDLAVRTGETVGLAYPDISKRQMLFVGIALSKEPLRVDPGIRRTCPLHAAAPGRAWLAHLPEEQVRRCLAGPLTALTEHTITSVPDLLAELAQTRKRGYALSREEGLVGAGGIAVPVRDEMGSVVAALSLAAPLQRTTDRNIERWVKLMHETSRELTRRLYVSRAEPIAPEQGAAGTASNQHPFTDGAIGSAVRKRYRVV